MPSVVNYAGRALLFAAARFFARVQGVTGFIDHASDGVVSGWIRRQGADRPLDIDVYLNGRKIAASAVANFYREDVRDAGFGDGRCGFRVEIDQEIAPGARVSVHLAGKAAPVVARLAEASARPLSLPADSPDYVLRIERGTSSDLTGWAAAARAPAQIFDLRIEIDGNPYGTIRNDRPRGDLRKNRVSAGRGGFAASLPIDWLEPGSHDVTIIAPDGTRASLRVTNPTQRYAASLSASYDKGKMVAGDVVVVVPIYNAIDDVRVCIERLRDWTPPETRIILIDDCSPDPAIAALLAGLKDDRFQVVTNPENLGFTRTVNTGMALAGGKDVVLLNSDARVTPGWLAGMIAAANSDRRIATVTPMSDRAGAFSAPGKGNDNDLPEGVDEITFAREFRRASLGLYPSVPTGNGFCMLIRRACLDKIGPLDQVAFPRGYGEENDFCIRALNAGWRNVIDDRSYVFHDRSKSFGEARSPLEAAGRAVIDARYPEYKRLIACFDEDSLIRTARLRGHVARQNAARPGAGKPRLVTVISGLSGGTPQTNADMMRALQGHFDCWVLRSTGARLELYRFIDGEMRMERAQNLADPIRAVSHRSDVYDQVAWEWLTALAPQIVHLRHILWHSLSLPRLARRAGARVIFSFHDFYTLCPSTKLIDGDGQFCGGICTLGEADCLPENWRADDLPRLRDAWVHRWRQMMRQMLEPCDAFVTTSPSARARLSAGFDGLDGKPFEVIEHGRDFSSFAQLGRVPQPGEPLRVLVPGNISAAKGLEIILDICAQDKGQTIEFHILGDANMINRATPDGLYLHGKYARDEFAARAAGIAPHLGVVLSVWDETYCHTLTELWAAGLPAAVFDFGTVAARVREHDMGWILPSVAPQDVMRSLQSIARDPADYAARTDAVVRWQAEIAPDQSTQRMGARYHALYQRLLDDRPVDIAAG